MMAHPNDELDLSNLLHCHTTTDENIVSFLDEQHGALANQQYMEQPRYETNPQMAREIATITEDDILNILGHTEEIVSETTAVDTNFTAGSETHATVISDHQTLNTNIIQSAASSVNLVETVNAVTDKVNQTTPGPQVVHFVQQHVQKQFVAEAPKPIIPPSNTVVVVSDAPAPQTVQSGNIPMKIQLPPGLPVGRYVLKQSLDSPGMMEISLQDTPTYHTISLPIATAAPPVPQLPRVVDTAVGQLSSIVPIVVRNIQGNNTAPVVTTSPEKPQTTIYSNINQAAVLQGTVVPASHVAPSPGTGLPNYTFTARAYDTRVHNLPGVRPQVSIIKSSPMGTKVPLYERKLPPPNQVSLLQTNAPTGKIVTQVRSLLPEKVGPPPPASSLLPSVLKSPIVTKGQPNVCPAMPVDTVSPVFIVKRAPVKSYVPAPNPEPVEYRITATGGMQMHMLQLTNNNGELPEKTAKLAAKHNPNWEHTIASEYINNKIKTAQLDNTYSPQFNPLPPTMATPASQVISQSSTATTNTTPVLVGASSLTPISGLLNFAQLKGIPGIQVKNIAGDKIDPLSIKTPLTEIRPVAPRMFHISKDNPPPCDIEGLNYSPRSLMVKDLVDPSETFIGQENTITPVVPLRGRSGSGKFSHTMVVIPIRDECLSFLNDAHSMHTLTKTVSRMDMAAKLMKDGDNSHVNCHSSDGDTPDRNSKHDGYSGLALAEVNGNKNAEIQNQLTDDKSGASEGGINADVESFGVEEIAEEAMEVDSSNINYSLTETGNQKADDSVVDAEANVNNETSGGPTRSVEEFSALSQSNNTEFSTNIESTPASSEDKENKSEHSELDRRETILQERRKEYRCMLEEQKKKIAERKRVLNALIGGGTSASALGKLFQSVPTLVDDPLEGDSSSHMYYCCYLCPFASYNESKVSVHWTIKHLHQSPYICAYCPAQFSASGKAHRHVQFAHPDKRTVMKLLPSEHFANDIEIEFIDATHKDAKVLPLIQLASQHDKVGKGGRYVCVECGDCELEKRCMRKHVLLKHLNLKPFTCSSCEMSFVSAYLADNHSCPLQAKSDSKASYIVNKEVLDVRQKLRIRDYYYKIPYNWPARFVPGTPFWFQTVTHTTAALAPSAKPDAPHSYLCKFCTFVCPSLEEIWQHVRLEHGLPLGIFCGRCSAYRRLTSCEREQEFFICCRCCRLISLRFCKEGERLDAITLQQVFRCNFCQETDADMASIRRHVKEHHIQVQPFSCNQCEEKFSSRQAAMLHSKQHPKSRSCIEKDDSLITAATAQVKQAYVRYMFAEHKDSILSALWTEYGKEVVAEMREQKRQLILNEEEVEREDDEEAVLADVSDEEAGVSTKKRVSKLPPGIRRIQAEYESFEGRHHYRCLICQYKCTDRSCMSRHVKYMHLRIHPHSCPYCGYSNVEKTKVKLHILNLHNKSSKKVKTNSTLVAALGEESKKHFVRVSPEGKDISPNEACNNQGFGRGRKRLAEEEVQDGGEEEEEEGEEEVALSGAELYDLNEAEVDDEHVLQLQQDIEQALGPQPDPPTLSEDWDIEIKIEPPDEEPYPYPRRSAKRPAASDPIILNRQKRRKKVGGAKGRAVNRKGARVYMDTCVQDDPRLFMVPVVVLQDIVTKVFS